MQIIIDTDLAFGSEHADIDDILALLLALSSPHFCVRAIVGTGGNVPVDRASAHIQQILKRIGREDIPHSFSTTRPFDPALWVSMRWKNLTSEELPAPPAKNEDAVSLLIRIVSESLEPISIITIGPLTTLALAYAQKPEIAHKIERVYMMGGSFRTAGVSLVGEFNVTVDPFAAALICESGIPLTMFGLDVTKKRRICPVDIDIWNNPLMPFVKELHNAAVSFMHFRAKRDGYDEAYAFFHDALPILYCLYPHLFQIQQCNIHVDTDGEFTRGMTIVDFKERNGQKLRHEIARDVDSTACLNIILQQICECWGKIQ